ncbi:MAG: aminotransferase class IV [Anaerolineae bacterium]
MPCLIKRLTPDGLHPVDYSASSLADAAKLEPRDGVYTVTNTYDTFNVLKLDAHLDRLEQSAQQAQIPLTLDRVRLRHALRALIQEAGYGDVRFRVTVPAESPDSLILSVEPFKPLSPDVIAAGVKVITVHAARHNPSAKTTDWMHDRDAIQKSLPPGIYDAVLTDPSGVLLENLGANFYAILDGELRTAGSGVLAGIAQQVVFTVAPSILPVRREAVHADDIPRLSEAFLTSASRGIVPIVEIDGIKLGNGTPGEKTLALRAAYQAWVTDHLEPL